MGLRADVYDPRSLVPPPHRLLEYRGTPHTVEVMCALALGNRGERSIKVRRHAEQIVNNVRPKDYASEALAIYYWWCTAGRYTRDPLHVELLKDPERMVDDAVAGRLVCDCDELALGIATDVLVLGGESRFVTVGFKAHPLWLPQSRAAIEAGNGFTHVFAQARDPRSKTWWALDPVAGRRVGRMLRRVKLARFYPIG